MCLAAIDRAPTNRLYLLQFQSGSRAMLTNFLRQAERWPASQLEQAGTNAAACRMAKKYLATH